jgi:hypothetical protein
MHHPHNRAERRHERTRVIARRRKVAETEWGYNDGDWLSRWNPYSEWGRYAKFNGGCGCRLCHHVKYFGCKRKRRNARKISESAAEFRCRDKAISDK